METFLFTLKVLFTLASISVVLHFIILTYFKKFKANLIVGGLFLSLLIMFISGVLLIGFYKIL